MTVSQINAGADSDLECSTVFTPSVAEEQEVDGLKDRSSVPWPGATYIIRSVSTDKVITFQHGQIVLSRLGGHDDIRWECVENKGWLGFQNPGSSMFLGYDENEELCCSAKKQDIWEHFCVRQRPEGGYVLLMPHYDNVWTIAWKELCPVGIRMKNGSEKLAIVGGWQSDSIVWEFIKVEPSQA